MKGTQYKLVQGHKIASVWWQQPPTIGKDHWAEGETPTSRRFRRAKRAFERRQSAKKPSAISSRNQVSDQRVEEVS